mgnify:CR=1 FL=1
MLKLFAAIFMVFALSFYAPPALSQAVDHSRHQAAAAAIRVTEAEYTPPLSTVLTERSGRHFTVGELLDTDDPLLLQFIFTTCPTVCPVLSVGFSGLQKRLTHEARPFRLLSISIDPEYDTPEVLAAYAEKFKAGEKWLMLTGDLERIRPIQGAFEAYFGVRKMDHQPLTFIRPSRTGPWRRIAGLPSPAELYAEYLAARTTKTVAAEQKGDGQ